MFFVRSPHLASTDHNMHTFSPVYSRKEGMKGKNKSKSRSGRGLWAEDSEEDVFGHRFAMDDVPTGGSLPSSVGLGNFYGGGGGGGGGVVGSSWKNSGVAAGVGAGAGTDILKTPPPIKPRNSVQEKYLKLLTDKNPPILIATGPAGVAKTYLCTAVAIQKLIDGSITKLIITRPAVSVDEEHGFLPGSLEEKMDPWMRPIYDVFYKYMSPARVQALIAKQVIEICPLAYMRGRTFDNAFIIADEMQNCTTNQMLMLLTRIGKDSKLVVTGDPAQFERGFQQNGLIDLLRKMEKAAIRKTETGEPPEEVEEDASMGIQVISFTAVHVERHPIIRRVLRLYESSS